MHLIPRLFFFSRFFWPSIFLSPLGVVPSATSFQNLLLLPASPQRFSAEPIDFQTFSEVNVPFCSSCPISYLVSSPSLFHPIFGFDMAPLRHCRSRRVRLRLFPPPLAHRTPLFILLGFGEERLRGTALSRRFFVTSLNSFCISRIWCPLPRFCDLSLLFFCPVISWSEVLSRHLEKRFFCPLPSDLVFHRAVDGCPCEEDTFSFLPSPKRGALLFSCAEIAFPRGCFLNPPLNAFSFFRLCILPISAMVSW